ncbi:MAG: hypothetical protein KO463_03665 [Candidatus Methanofastidiosa archaeon]|nr:hypothetical protein [Candidatus Methanofastidiosa archaeon]
MELYPDTVGATDDGSYEFHINLFGSLCRILQINGVSVEDIAELFDMPVAIVSLYMSSRAKLPDPDTLKSAGEVRDVRHYPPFCFMGADAFEAYCQRIEQVKNVAQYEADTP